MHPVAEATRLVSLVVKQEVVELGEDREDFLVEETSAAGLVTLVMVVG